MAEVKIIEHVKGLGDIYSVKAPFNEQLELLNETGIKYPISVRDASYLRLKKDCLLDTRTCHSPILTKDSPVIVARISPLVTDLEMAKQAVEAHKKNQYPNFSKKVYNKWHEIAEKEKDKKPENRKAIILPERRDYKIHKDSDEARFLFQDIRKDYFNKFVSGDNIQFYQVEPKIVDSQDDTIVNYLWFCRPDFGSDLDFRLRDLDYHYGALGVLKKASFAGSQKFSGYSNNQVEDALKSVLEKEGLMGLEKKIIRPIIRALKRNK